MSAVNSPDGGLCNKLEVLTYDWIKPGAGQPGWQVGQIRPSTNLDGFRANPELGLRMER
jgi:hypothetical protein